MHSIFVKVLAHGIDEYGMLTKAQKWRGWWVVQALSANHVIRFSCNTSIRSFSSIRSVPDASGAICSV